MGCPLIYPEASIPDKLPIFADDAIALLSQQQYIDDVYPYYKRIFDAFCDGSAASFHHYERWPIRHDHCEQPCPHDTR
jgi:hypothetical protein